MDLTKEMAKVEEPKVKVNLKTKTSAANDAVLGSASVKSVQSPPGGVLNLFEEFRKGRGQQSIRKRAETFRAAYDLTAAEVKLLASVAKKMAFSVSENDALKEKINAEAAAYVSGAVHQAWLERMKAVNALITSKKIEKTSWAVFIVAYQEEFISFYNNASKFAYHHELEHTFYFKTYYAGASWAIGVDDWDWRFQRVHFFMETMALVAGGESLGAKDRGIFCSKAIELDDDPKPLVVTKSEHKDSNTVAALSVPILIDPQSLFNCYDAKTDPERKATITTEIARRMLLVIQLAFAVDNKEVKDYGGVVLARVKGMPNKFLDDYFESAKYLRAFMRSFKIAKWGKASGAAAQRDFLVKTTVQMTTFLNQFKFQKPGKAQTKVLLKSSKYAPKELSGMA